MLSSTMKVLLLLGACATVSSISLTKSPSHGSLSKKSAQQFAQGSLTKESAQQFAQGSLTKESAQQFAQVLALHSKLTQDSGILQKKDPSGSEVSQGIYLNNFSKTLLNLLKSLNVVSTSKEPQYKQTPIKGITLPTGQTITKGPLSLDTISGSVAAILAVLAAVGAGIAALIAFAIPPLQIANQILAIIAVALLIAYIAEDKHYIPPNYYETTAYKYKPGYDSGYPAEYAAQGTSGYPSSHDTSGYGAAYSTHNTAGYASDPASSYSSYRRSSSSKYKAPQSKPSYRGDYKNYNYPNSVDNHAAPDTKNQYSPVYPYDSKNLDTIHGKRGPGGLKPPIQRQGGVEGWNNETEKTNTISSSEEARSMSRVPTFVLNKISNVAHGAINKLHSLYDGY